MSIEDPYFIVKDEVFRALNRTRGLYLRFRDVSSTNSVEAVWITNELRNSLRSIEWDLEDLEDTINIVEKNRNKFNIDERELSSRLCFIEATRNEVKSMKDTVNFHAQQEKLNTARQPLLDKDQPEDCIIGNNSSNSNILSSTITGMTRHSGTKYSKLENSLDSPGHYANAGLDKPAHGFIGESVSLQQRMILGQDEQLDVISDSIGTLKTVSRQINTELDEQAVMLHDFGNELENTESKIDSTLKKVAKVLRMNNDTRQWMAIGILSALLFIVILLFILL